MGTEKRERQRQARQEKIAELRKNQQRQTYKSRGVLIGGLVALVIVGALIYSVAFGSDDGDDTDVATDDTVATDETSATDNTTDPNDGAATGEPAPCPEPDGSSERRTEFPAPPEMCIDASRTYTATMVTDAGTIEIELFDDKAPVTVNNFVYLARYHYFDGLNFHRVIPDFVLQGGDPQGDGTGGPGYSFEDELPERDEYQAGSLAMANSGPNTNGSQFFVVTSEQGAQTLVDAVGGTAAYSLFGQVTEGLDVVAAIEADGSAAGTPETTHTIESVTITES